MNVGRLLRLDGTITRTADGTEDVFGDTPETDSGHFSVKCWISQYERDEVTINADTQGETLHLYLEAAADGRVSGADRITIAGSAYELVGPPWSATNPRTGRVTHLEATIRKVA